ncbi:MAG: phosphoribosylformylglycinamidine cyclo-ligase [Rhabdochlamydiaceae bacterium]
MSSYLQAGVNLDAAAQWIQKLKSASSSIGGFGGLYPLGDDYLVASADGVGTKLKLAFAMDRHETVGIDLVAMNVNDILTCGAKPLFFLDYIATSSLDLEQMEKVVAGILQGCSEAGCLLLGGETAQMPDFYKAGEYDLAGFAVGIVKQKDRIDGRHVRAGDLLVGLPSSGPHSNGFSLIRKIVGEDPNELHKSIDGSGKTLGELLLTPTRIYVKQVHELLSRYPIKAMAHITGGAFWKNIPRMLPAGLSAALFNNSWPVPYIFHYLQEKGGIAEEEMLRIFNRGIGFVLVLSPASAKELCNQEKDHFIIGEVIEGTGMLCR